VALQKISFYDCCFRILMILFKEIDSTHSDLFPHTIY